MILKFVNHDNPSRTRVIANVKTEQEAFSEIQKFLEEHNYTSYYTRVWFQDDIKIYDVGSYTEFFHLELEEGEEFRRNLEENEDEKQIKFEF